MSALVWFRRDLRTQDNPALYQAAQSTCVYGVYVVTPQQWQMHGLGAPAVTWWLAHVQALQKELQTLGIPLYLLWVNDFSQVSQGLHWLASQLKVSAVYFNREYEWNERQRDQHVTQTLQAANYQVVSYDDQVIFTPGSLLTGQGKVYTVFTPFYKKWCASLAQQSLYTCPPPQAQKWPKLPEFPQATPFRICLHWQTQDTQQIQAIWPDYPWDLSAYTRALYYPSVQAHGVVGSEAACQQFEAFIEAQQAVAPYRAGLLDYTQARDYPSLQATSGLSGALAVGALSIRQALTRIQAVDAEALNPSAAHKDAGASRWVAELVWREFYRHILYAFPRVSRNQAFKLETHKLAWRHDQAAFAAWCQGRTGYPLVDAGMRQLVATGWMHNRLRMLTAMFLSKHLLLDWRLGEAFFMRHLVDADLASNNGGWQWAASTGTDAVPYFRIFNPSTQSQRFDAQGHFIRTWVPELAQVTGNEIHQPKDTTRARVGYATACVEHAQARQRALEAFKALSA
ncbi:deoxyribodipyrimidine photo-lyase [Allopseudospirillum japonicum]|uniref:Deoxyribodipyrimidine photo-lyase n=1 Tax=Allopseudospirillum japonicum TaxID=64971 RepID=A0A1H6RF89_9GAMM|nr:FAD-binding domain-containing protein [Allopseudospirillum japonicum]SEI49852.1 deoxyribodipyrimidine photo-lyase [Allopseudospirillum japonicum]